MMGIIDITKDGRLSKATQQPRQDASRNGGPAHGSHVMTISLASLCLSFAAGNDARSWLTTAMLR